MRFYEYLGVREDNLCVVVERRYVVTVDQFDSILLFRANLSKNNFSVRHWQRVILAAMKQLDR